jgi:PEP-CTERM motif
MSRPMRVSHALLLLAFLLFAAAETHADTFTITGGNVSMSLARGSFRVSNYEVRWDQNSFVRGGVSDSSGQSSQVNCAGGGLCSGGSGAYVTGSTRLPTEVPGSFNIPGTLPDGPPGSVSIGGRFNGSLLSFSTASFLFPEDPNTADGLVTITTHFTASGAIMVQNIAPNFQTTQVFAGDFLGSGTATFVFGYVSSSVHVLELRSANYQFEPVPEPATLLLLGTGVAGLAARQRRRSRLRKLQKSVS